MDAGSSNGSANPLINGTASDVPLWQPHRIATMLLYMMVQDPL